jgi:hypothetical protein
MMDVQKTVDNWTAKDQTRDGCNTYVGPGESRQSLKVILNESWSPRAALLVTTYWQ